MALIIAHTVKDFFDNREYREESTDHPSEKDTQKCMRALLKDSLIETSIKFNNFVFFFDSIADFQDRRITVYEYTSPNIREENVVSVAEARKMLRSILQDTK